MFKKAIDWTKVLPEHLTKLTNKLDKHIQSEVLVEYKSHENISESIAKLFLLFQNHYRLSHSQNIFSFLN